MSECALKLRLNEGAPRGASRSVREYVHDDDALFVGTANELHVHNVVRQKVSGEQCAQPSADPLHGYNEGSLRWARNVM